MESYATTYAGKSNHVIQNMPFNGVNSIKVIHKCQFNYYCYSTFRLVVSSNRLPRQKFTSCFRFTRFGWSGGGEGMGEVYNATQNCQDICHNSPSIRSIILLNNVFMLFAFLYRGGGGGRVTSRL